VPSNRLLFVSNNGQSFNIQFVNQAWQILGFSPTDNMIAGTAVISTQPLVARQNSELYIRLNNVTTGDGNLNYDNYRGKQLSPSTILSVIPIQVAPYQTQWTDNSVYGQIVGVFVANEKLNNLSIDIVDANGNYADWISDWTATVKVQIVPVKDESIEEMKSSLMAIQETLNKLLTLKVIGRPQNYVR
jgi:hypothetical protein